MKFYKIKYTETDLAITDRGKKCAGFCISTPYWPFSTIIIGQKYKDDVSVHKHEIMHSKQHLRWWTLHPILYDISKKYRLKAEIEAYKEQLKYPPVSNNAESYKKLFIDIIHKEYNFSLEEIEKEFDK